MASQLRWCVTSNFIYLRKLEGNLKPCHVFSHFDFFSYKEEDTESLSDMRYSKFRHRFLGRVGGMTNSLVNVDNTRTSSLLFS